MSKKTSFKDLLAKGGSNPLVNLQGLKEQRRKIEELKHKASSGPTQEPAAKRQAMGASFGALSQPAAPAGAGAISTVTPFISAPTFAGARRGYTFKAGPQGVGYYADSAAGAGATSCVPVPAKTESSTVAGSAIAGDAGGGATGLPGAADGEGGGAPLPRDFFDNPQNDPANRGKEVAATRKEQQLREEMEEFNRLVSVDVVAAQANDEEELEEEAETTELQALQEQVQLSRRVDHLRDMRGKALALAARVAAEAAETKAQQQGGTPANADGGESGGSDDDEEDDGGLSALDWRARTLR